MGIPKMMQDLAVIQKLSDLPNATDGLTAQALKAKFDESGLSIQKWINDVLLPGLLAGNVAFQGSSELAAADVQAAIELVHSQVRDAATGTIVNGSVTKEKIAAALMERIFGGRPWVSLDRPDMKHNPETEFPVGQIWLRPAFAVTNLAGENWTAIGCSAAAENNLLTVTGNKTVASASVTQTQSGLGYSGDRIRVLLELADRDPEIASLKISLNGADEAVGQGGVFETSLLSDGSLTVRMTADWHSASLADGTFAVRNFAVVNLDAILRNAGNVREMEDWNSWLQTIVPFRTYDAPRQMYIQTAEGIWEQFDHEVFPVTRGGTGFARIRAGEIPVGGSDNTLEKLEGAQTNESFLQFTDGRPVWRSPADVIGTLASLRIATGTYSGTGSYHSEMLAVQPKLLYISSPSGCSRDTGGLGTMYRDRPCILGQGSSDEASYTVPVEGGTQTRHGTVKLNGSTLTLNNPYLCNRSGVTYHWVAIY